MGYEHGEQRWTKVTEYVDGGVQQLVETSSRSGRGRVWVSTANHRWLCEKTLGKGKRYREEYFNTAFLRTVSGAGRKTGIRVKHSALFNNPNPSRVSPAEAALLAWLWGGGSINNPESGERLAYSITQPERNRDYCSKIEGVFRSLGTPIKFYRLPENPHIRRYLVPDHLIHTIYEKAGINVEEPHYTGFILGLSRGALESWFLHFWFADGSKSQPFPQVFCQRRKANPEKYEALLLAGHLLGHTPIAGRDDLLNFETPTASLRRLSYKDLGQHPVACLVTETSNFVMRQGDFVTITGNSKFDFSFLKAEHGIELSPIFDTMLAAQLLAGGDQRPSFSLEAVAGRHGNIEVDKTVRSEDWSKEKLSEAQIKYAAYDAAVLLPLREHLLEELREEKLLRVSDIEFRAVAAIAEMELAGIKLDIERWRELEEVIRGRRDEAALKLDEQFPEPEGMLPLEGLGPRLNLNSPQQITDAFRSLGIALPDTKVWTLLKVDHPAARLLLEYRELQKKLGTYLETYPKFVDKKTGRIHANFLQCRVPTGRLACTSPNIQQVPHENEFRRCFVAGEGNVFVIADYSQIELRILAELSGDPGFVQAFQEGEDLHRVTAATMFGVERDEVTKEQRSAAKRINFGLAYGRGAKSLSAQLGTDEKRARELIDEYFANYPKVQRYLQGTASRAMKTGTLRTLSGRIRKFEETAELDSAARGAMRREAMNYPIQGASADIAKLALIYVREELKGLDAQLVNCIHDEFVVECKEEVAGEAAGKMKIAMNEAGAKLLKKVSTEVEVGISHEWRK
jgi:DNA polymerase-1